jgi:site-specific DNA-methyltransferase (adenine-specific)
VGGHQTKNSGTRYPRSVLRFKSAKKPVHPTEKPVELMKYLIETYSMPDAIVLDFFCGSGTTLDACRQTGRNFIGCDFNPQWVDYSRNRLTQPYTLSMFRTAG